jgi:hypothetical protein
MTDVWNCNHMYWQKARWVRVFAHCREGSVHTAFNKTSVMSRQGRICYMRAYTYRHTRREVKRIIYIVKLRVQMAPFCSDKSPQWAHLYFTQRMISKLGVSFVSIPASKIQKHGSIPCKSSIPLVYLTAFSRQHELHYRQLQMQTEAVSPLTFAWWCPHSTCCTHTVTPWIIHSLYNIFIVISSFKYWNNLRTQQQDT